MHVVVEIWRSSKQQIKKYKLVRIKEVKKLSSINLHQEVNYSNSFSMGNLIYDPGVVDGIEESLNEDERHVNYQENPIYKGDLNESRKEANF